jgi:hypothetical protein
MLQSTAMDILTSLLSIAASVPYGMCSAVLFSPRDFTGWAWLLLGIGAATIFLVSLQIADNSRTKWLIGIFAVLSILAGCTSGLCFLIALVRLLRWF